MTDAAIVETVDEVVPPAEVPPEPEESEQVIVTFGDTPAPEEKEQEAAPEWVRDLRVKQRELAKENRALKEQLAAREQAAQKPSELGKKPTLEDHGYDTGKYEEDLAAWFERKREHDAALAARKAEEDKAKTEWETKLAGYEQAKVALKAEDFDEAEALIMSSFNQTQQGVVLHGADNPALLVLALGRNPEKLKELAAIKDPVKFAFTVAKLETQMKTTTRKPPAPEKKPSGSAPISGAVDAALDRLEAEAEKTGDRSKVIAYKRAQKNK